MMKIEQEVSEMVASEPMVPRPLLAPAGPITIESGPTVSLDRNMRRIYRGLQATQAAALAARWVDLHAELLRLHLDLRREMDWAEGAVSQGELHDLVVHHVEIEFLLEELYDVLNSGQSHRPWFLPTIQRRLEELAGTLSSYESYVRDQTH
jgi:hypothetical protein